MKGKVQYSTLGKAMKDKKELAQKYFRQGYNCAQAVFLAYAEDYDIDKDTAVKISAGFGGGMGRMREVCGAVSGMIMVAGLESATLELKDVNGKKKNYEMVQEMSRLFKEKNRSIICRELLGIEQPKEHEAKERTPEVSAASAMPEERTEEYYRKRPCVELVGDACEIIERITSFK